MSTIDKETHPLYPSVEATDCITNPWCVAPDTNGVIEAGVLSMRSTRRQWIITSPCRVVLDYLPLTLCFSANRILFLGDPNSTFSVLEPLCNYVSFRTFVDYSTTGVDTLDPNTINLKPVDFVTFRVNRLVRREIDHHVAGRHRTGIVVNAKEAMLTVRTIDLSNYLRVLDRPLYDSIYFYLTGCRNTRYFLVDYYKAVEAIRSELGGDRGMITSLGRFGIRREAYGSFQALCNSGTDGRIDIARHAPKRGAAPRTLDLEYLLVAPDSLAAFAKATIFCRRVIESYIAYKLARQTTRTD